MWRERKGLNFGLDLCQATHAESAGVVLRSTIAVPADDALGPKAHDMR